MENQTAISRQQTLSHIIEHQSSKWLRIKTYK